jgi:hypothetical protein
MMEAVSVFAALLLALVAFLLAEVKGLQRFLKERGQELEEARSRSLNILMELGEERADRRKAEEALVHHLATMRREGYTPQPQDSGWEAYTLSPELEAEIEQRRLGTGLENPD